MRSRIVFIVSASDPESGSTLLRSHQLQQLIAPLLETPGVQSITTDRTDFDNAILILGKNALLAATPGSIQRLKKDGNIVCADPLDGRVKRDVLVNADILIAASMTQLHDLRRKFRTQKVIYVAHHVDLRMNSVSPPTDKFRMAYFGEPVNARFVDELSGIVTFVKTDTSSATNTEWMNFLPQYNAHYAIRRSRSIDGHKPFTKGFVAAHCQCPILVSADDREARILLGPDYPYFAEDSSLDEVRAAISRMRDDFGGADWLRALAATRKLQVVSSPTTVARQLYEGIAPEISGRRRSSVNNLLRNFLFALGQNLSSRF